MASVTGSEERSEVSAVADMTQPPQSRLRKASAQFDSDNAGMWGLPVQALDPVSPQIRKLQSKIETLAAKNAEIEEMKKQMKNLTPTEEIQSDPVEVPVRDDIKIYPAALIKKGSLISHKDLTSSRFMPKELVDELSNDLMEWVKRQTRAYQNVQIKNMITGWSDGYTLCALLNSLMPEKLHVDQLSPNSRKKNLQLAFEVLRNEGIPVILDLDQLMLQRDPDQYNVFDQLHHIYAHFNPPLIEFKQIDPFVE